MRDLFRGALDRARAAGTYNINTGLDQVLTPERSLFTGAQPESVHFELEGRMAGPQEARFTLTPGRATFGIADRAAKEFLVKDGVAYLRQGERWVRTDAMPGLVGVDSDGLLLASAAQAHTRLDPPDAPPGLDALTANITRIGFELRPAAVTEALLARQTQLSAQARALARLQAPEISGRGELWIGGDGLPVRLILQLSWVRQGTEPVHVSVRSETTYSGFGVPARAQEFNPNRSAATGEILADDPLLHWLPVGLWAAVLLMLALLLWLLRRAQGNRRLARRVVTILLLLGLLAPAITPVVEASGAGDRLRGQEPETEIVPGGELREMVQEMQQIAVKRGFSEENPANGLAALDDEDGDGLPNGYELSLGTNPFYEDTDYDGLTDKEEVEGVPCFIEFLNAERAIQSDPVNPDSNYDGLKDGDEYHRGMCTDGTSVGNVWRDDNDKDGVPDGIDLSPFSSSWTQGTNDSSRLGGKWDGAAFDFESLDMDPSDKRTILYPFYVELQIRPDKKESLRWAYKNLWWPGDDKGPIRNTDPILRVLTKIFKGIEIGTSGKITLLPFLSAKMVQADLPSAGAMAEFGVSAAPARDDDGNQLYQDGQALYELTMPLVPVERGGQVYAFQAKMLHDQNGNDDLVRRWQDVRLKWAVMGDVLMKDDNGEPVASPDGAYGLTVFDEAYTVTGLQVQRQGGASVLLAAHLPEHKTRTLYDDGPIATLRAGMEHKFLTGELGMSQIKSRFDDPTSATVEQRWGIPLEKRFRVQYDETMHYRHLDQALAATTMTTTQQLLLNEFDDFENLEPTLLLATEQRTSTVNLDDDWSTDYRAISINTCLKPLITTRSIKLQTYEWKLEGLLGVWSPLSLDDVLAKVENEYASSTPASYEFFDEELSILKMTTTAWYIGQTSVLKIGQQSWYDLMNVLSDAKLAVHFLTADGLFPSEFKDVVFNLLKVFENGDPVEWFKKQWNTVVGYYEDVKEFFEGSYVDYAPPASRITVISQGGGEGGGGSPPAEAEPLDKTILSYTETALSVLGLLASYFGGVFQEIVEILTKIVQIYKQLRQLIDVIKTIVDVAVLAAANPVLQSAEVVAGMLAHELGSLAKPLAIVGLIFAIGMIWVMTAVQLNDVGPSIALTLVVKAIVETILLVVLFVIAAIFPWGTLVAVVIGLIKLIESVIGFAIDPISLLLDWLFSVESYERVYLPDKIGSDDNPRTGNPSIKPVEPGGGFLSGRTFRVKVPAIIRMRTKNDGTKSDLEQGFAKMHVGRWTDGREYSLCTPDPDTFNLYKERLAGYWFKEFHALETDCVHFRLPPEKYWHFTPDGAHNADAAVKTASGRWQRDIFSSAWVDVNPTAKINARLLFDISMWVQIPVDHCSTVGGCDRIYFKGTGAPTIGKTYLDIIPGGLKGLWEWDELENRDPDGDGLIGYISPFTGKPAGPDANLCPNKSGFQTIEDWDSDDDGLSDKFEVENDGFNPCKKDSDGDKLEDGQELLIGTRPDRKDTDRDSLSDYDEVARTNSAGNLVTPWIIQLSSQYPGLPDAFAFPSPLQANRDGDHRNDSKEKAKGTSPNSFNPVPVGDPLELGIGQSLRHVNDGGGTVISLTSSPWVNDEALAIEPTLTVTLPVGFANLNTSTGLKPPMSYSGMNFGVPEATGDPNVFRWKLPVIHLGRYVVGTLDGVPVVPTEPVSITASLTYGEGAKQQTTSAVAPLRVNAGGPVVTIAGVSGGVILNSSRAASGDSVSFFANSGTPVIVQGTAVDPERVIQVYVCLVPQGSPCGISDWKIANGRNAWSYSFTPANDGLYTARAYGVDFYGMTGTTVSEDVGVDRTKPTAISLDLSGTVYLSTQSSARTDPPGLPVVTISGQASDATGPTYVSGVQRIGVTVDNGKELHATDVDNPGAVSSRFSFEWEPPNRGQGHSLRNGQGLYQLTVGVEDAAGNPGDVTDSVNIVIDDTPPLVYPQPPQVSDSTTFKLSGLADDTALVIARQPVEPFSPTLTLNESNTMVSISGSQGKAIIVSDVNADAIDDLVLLTPAGLGAVPIAFRAGLFFGKPGGFPAPLSMDNPDVLLVGELPVDLLDFAPTAAGVGDVNGDGIGDLLLGSPSSQSGEGTAYLVLGKRSGDWPTSINLSAADWRLEQGGALGFGATLSPAGDVNGDGLADFLVGAARVDKTDAPAWLYLGRETGVADAHRRFDPHRNADPLPPNLAGLGDTNGDGLSDFLIAPHDAPVALVLGRPDGEWFLDPFRLEASADALINGVGAQQTVSPGGDVNEDGLMDALIGDPDGVPAAVYVMYGRRAENALATAPTITSISDASHASFMEPAGPGGSARLGAGLAALGDVDEDGTDDFSFGQPGVGRSGSRIAIVLTGRTALAHNLPVEAATYLISGTVASNLGSYLSAGDISGDHLPDVLGGAPGQQQAHIFQGNFDPGGVAGIAKVEVGLFGPVSDPTKPFTDTYPTNWQAATLENEWNGIRPWHAQMTAPGDGDYRLYARATDRAGNVSADWYAGNVKVNTAVAAFAGANLTMDAPTLTNKTDLALAGAVNGGQMPQHLRAWNGYHWKRLPPAAGNWNWNSEIPLHDLYRETYRVVARDAFGNVLHASQAQNVDTLVQAPVISSSLPVNIWHTDTSPQLTLSWPAPTDGSGIASVEAVIDMISETVPSTAAPGNQINLNLAQPGVYYGHVRVVDTPGNEALVHTGPFLRNSSTTPSVILADGLMDEDGGEYPPGTLLNYDPYAAIKPAAFWGTWDTQHLYLAYPGSPWGDTNRLAIYLDTKAGGLNSSLDLTRSQTGNVHTLPFDADYALVVGGPIAAPTTLYRANGGWTPVANAKSYGEMDTDTEIVLDRAEIEANGSVGLLAYGESEAGVWMTLPGGARPDTTSPMTGSLTFGDKLFWPGLNDGLQPGAGQNQVVAPVVNVLLPRQNAMLAGQGSGFQVTIHNPDVGGYVNVPFSITVDTKMSLQSISGAICSNCPAGASEWELLANVAAGKTQTATIQTQMGGAGLQGVFPVGVGIRLRNSGLPSRPQAPARATYVLDHSSAVIKPINTGTIYRKVDTNVFTVLPGLDISQIFRCASLVEVNTGGSWQSLCKFGDCFQFSYSVTNGASTQMKVRTRGADGRTSPEQTLTVVGDNVAPSIQVSPTAVFSGTNGLLQGLAWDTFPTTQAPARVEVSLNGGRFRQASVSAQTQILRRRGIDTTGAPWRLPVRFGKIDGAPVMVVARAMDEAGNVSGETTPFTVTLDSVGPTIGVTLTNGILSGTVTDGSGVASVAVSLDGGSTYLPLAISGGLFSYDMASWNGGPIQALALIRAVDIHGNGSVAGIPLPQAPEMKLYMPHLEKSSLRRTETSAAMEEVDVVQPAGDTLQWTVHLPAVGR